MNYVILELLHVLFKHKILIVGIFVAIFGSVAVGLLFRSDFYRAPGRLMITGQRAYFRLSPTDTRQGGTPDLRDINTEIENMKSANFLKKVVKTLPFSLNGAKTTTVATSQEEQGSLARVISFVKGTVSSIATFPARMSAVVFSPFASESSDSSQTAQEGLSPELRRELAALRAGLNVTAVPNSTLVEVSFTHKDPKKAAAIVNAILDVYPKHQASLQQDPIALAFYDKQKQQLEEQIAALLVQRKDFEERENAVDLREQKQQVLRLIDKVKDRLKGADLDIEQGLGKIAKLKQEIPKQPETVVQAQERADPERKLLQERLTTLELEKNELLQRYTDKDRRVQEKEAEMLAVKAKLASPEREKIVVGERLGPNPVRQDMVREWSNQTIKLGQIYPKRDTLARQVTELYNELEELNAKSYKYESMEESLKNMKERYALYSKKAEEARIANAMDQEDLVNVRITDRAQVPLVPIPSNATILLILAAIVGASAGVGGVLALEYVRPTFHSELDVERHLQLPVLALIPDLREEA
ncbi:MAG: GumC family protein [Candidatus Binatia bacterium]